MKKFTFNFGFLDRFKKSKTAEPSESNEDTTPHSEYDSDESPEDFAEKTLGGFNINKYQKDLQDAANASLENDNNDENTNDNEQSENSTEQFKFEEMTFPRAPEAPRKFKFNFPKFNRHAATDRIKASLSGKSPPPLHAPQSAASEHVSLRFFCR